MKIITYGEGGYKPNQQDKNVVEEVEIDEGKTPEEAKKEALAELEVTLQDPKADTATALKELVSLLKGE